MNVLIPIFRPYYLETGLALHVRNLVQTLEEAGWQVDVLLYTEETEVTLPGARVKVIFARRRWWPRMTAFSYFRRGLFNLLIFSQALGLCWSRKYEVIHTLGESAFLAALLKRLFGNKLVYDMNAPVREALRRPGLHALKSIWLRLEKFLLRSADLVLSPCGSLTELARADCPEIRVEQIAPPPLFPAFREDDEGALNLRHQLGIDRARVVLYGANFSGCQGVEALLKAARLVNKQLPDVHFIVMGVEYPRIKWLGTLARSLDLGARVTFLAKRPPAEMPAFFSLAEVLVSVRTQGLLLPVEITTALQSGKPLVATHHPIHTQLLTDQEAFLVMPNPDDIAQGLLQVLQDPEKARERGVRARALVATYHSLASYKHRIRTRYREMIHPQA